MMLSTVTLLAQIILTPPAGPPVVTPATLPPVGPPAATQPVVMVDALTVADSAIRSTFAERLGIAPGTVVWRWERDGTLPLPAGATARVLSISRDGRATLQFGMGQATLGLGQARVGQAVSLPVAARPIRTGTVLDSADRVFRVDTLWGDPRHPPVIDVIGWAAMAPLAEGMILVPPRVRPKAAVIAGRPVTVLWVVDGIQMRRAGVAMSNGTLGERVRVRLGQVGGTTTLIETRVAGTALVEAL